MRVVCLIFALIAILCLADSSVIYRYDTPENQKSPTRNKRQTDGESEERCGRDFDSQGNLRASVTLPKYNETVNFYSQNADCEWTIRGPDDSHVVLISGEFAIEMSENCEWDYVEISEGGFHPMSARFCGYDPVTYISTSNEVTIRFHSDESFEDIGFTFDVHTVSSVDESKCNTAIIGGEDGYISSPGYPGPSPPREEQCFYWIKAPEGYLVQFDLVEADFGDKTCEEECVLVYNGISTQGDPIGTLCSGATSGIQPFATRNAFVHFRTMWSSPGRGFKLRYRFVAGDTTTTTLGPTFPSPVGGNPDCSGFYSDLGGSTMEYEAPEFSNNVNCILVFRNEILPNHVIQVKFENFDIEESTDCVFDSLKIISGERADSKSLGIFCGNQLDQRTFVSSGNSLRLEFQTDESFALVGFTAKISFVPVEGCECDNGAICVRKGNERLCIYGTECDRNVCQNGGTCIQTGGDFGCYCSPGYHGTTCSQIVEGALRPLRFITQPSNAKIQRGMGHYPQCTVDDPDAEYSWIFNNEVVPLYKQSTGFGYRRGGLLQIDSFSDDLEGWYTCIARTATNLAEYNFDLFLAEDCNLRIYPGPGNPTGKLGNSVIIPCYSPRAAEVRWSKDGVLIDFERNPRFVQMNNNYLAINSVEMDDAGYYRCEAISGGGCVVSREGQLTVVPMKLTSQVCGRSIFDEAVSAAERVSRGSETEQGESPWHVSIISNVPGKNKEPFCGGTLISTRWVVTAAHCIAYFNQSSKVGGVAFNQQNVLLVLGTNQCLDPSSGTLRAPRTVIVHPQYNQRAYMDSDLALLELDSPVEYNDFVRPICLDDDGFVQTVLLKKRLTSTNGKVVGCGKRRSRDLTGTPTVQQVEVPYVDFDTCKETVEAETEDQELTDTMICYGYDMARKGDACQGDSGGSVVMDFEGRWYITGLVSWGIGCDRAGTYGVYTRITAFYDWIRDFTRFDEEEVHVPT